MNRITPSMLPSLAITATEEFTPKVTLSISPLTRLEFCFLAIGCKRITDGNKTEHMFVKKSKQTHFSA